MNKLRSLIFVSIFLSLWFWKKTRLKTLFEITKKIERGVSCRVEKNQSSLRSTVVLYNTCCMKIRTRISRIEEFRIGPLKSTKKQRVWSTKRWDKERAGSPLKAVVELQLKWCFKFFALQLCLNIGDILSIRTLYSILCSHYSLNSYSIF